MLVQMLKPFAKNCTFSLQVKDARNKCLWDTVDVLGIITMTDDQSMWTAEEKAQCDFGYNLLYHKATLIFESLSWKESVNKQNVSCHPKHPMLTSNSFDKLALTGNIVNCSVEYDTGSL